MHTLAPAIGILLLASPASALTINAIFGSNLSSDPNSAAIESTINAVIGKYETLFSNQATVTIDFQEMSSGLGQSQKTLYSMSYSAFRAAIAANVSDADQAAALAVDYAPGPDNPVDGNTNIAISTANIKALHITGNFPSSLSCGASCDGIISLNTSLTDVGSPGSTGQYSLTVVVEHEIDEVLGLGSSLGQSFQSLPSPEDFFRYGANGSRSYTTNSAAKAFFSINGTTDIAQFDNQNDGGDWGDWQSNPLPAGVQPEVQDAFATPGADPALSAELRALNVIGYDLAAPEPGTLLLVSGYLMILFRSRYECLRLVMGKILTAERK